MLKKFIIGQWMFLNDLKHLYKFWPNIIKTKTFVTIGLTFISVFAPK
jgi:hypothetical protein